MTPAIECIGLSKTYCGRRPVSALRCLDLEVRQGEVLGLIGHNGAGKTTLLRILAGILRPSSGRAALMGFEPGSLEARRRVAHLPDDPGFPASWLSARSMVRCTAALDRCGRAWDAKRIDALLDDVGLEERSRPVDSFSRGMRRKMGLALALMGDPQVVMLDEPTGDLDPEARMRFRELVRRLKERGVAVLFSSHVLSELETACDRAAFLGQGSLLAIHDLGEDRPDAPVRIVHGRGPCGSRTESVADPQASEWVETIVPAHERDERLRALVAAGATIARVEPVSDSLELLFRKYMSAPPPAASSETP